MDRLEIVTFILWGVGSAVVVRAVAAAINGRWESFAALAAIGFVLLGLGGFRPLGALLWHGIAETHEIGKEAEKAATE